MELKATITAKGAILNGQSPAIIKGDLKAAMGEAVALLEREVKKKGRTPRGVFADQGGLVSTIYGEVVAFGTFFKGVVGHQSKYGDVIEMGRRPGQKMPPAGAMLRWVEMKTGLSGKAAQQVEFLIRRKIGQKGFEGAHMFEKTWRENQDQLRKIFDRAGLNIAFHLSEDKS